MRGQCSEEWRQRDWKRKSGDAWYSDAILYWAVGKTTADRYPPHRAKPASYRLAVARLSVNFARRASMKNLLAVAFMGALLCAVALAQSTTPSPAEPGAAQPPAAQPVPQAVVLRSE